MILSVGAISAGENVQMNETLGFNETLPVAGDDNGYQILNEGNQTSDDGNQTLLKTLQYQKSKLRFRQTRKPQYIKRIHISS